MIMPEMSSFGQSQRFSVGVTCSRFRGIVPADDHPRPTTRPDSDKPIPAVFAELSTYIFLAFRLF